MYALKNGYIYSQVNELVSIPLSLIRFVERLHYICEMIEVRTSDILVIHIKN